MLAGHKFEAREFYCEPCEASDLASQTKAYHESVRRSDLKRDQKAARIEALKAKGALTTEEANELSALNASLVDGPAAMLGDYIREGLNGTNRRNPLHDYNRDDY